MKLEVEEQEVGFTLALRHWLPFCQAVRMLFPSRHLVLLCLLPIAAEPSGRCAGGAAGGRNPGSKEGSEGWWLVFFLRSRSTMLVVYPCPAAPSVQAAEEKLWVATQLEERRRQLKAEVGCVA